MNEPTPLPLFFQNLLSARGIHDPEAFLRPAQWTDLPQPSTLPGLPEATGRILKAIREREPIAIFGDYDNDGIAGTAILQAMLQLAGSRPRVYLPCRNDGYGLTASAVHRCSREGARLLICIDNGIAAADPIRLAHRLGIDVVVIDHHAKQADPAHAFVLWDSAHCGATLAFMVAWEIAQQIDLHPLQGLLGGFARLAALAAIADCIPLTGTVRTLVRLGFDALPSTPHPGLRYLLESAGIAGVVRSRDLSFGVCPVINSSGRLATPMMALEMLTERDEERARGLAEQLIQLNISRRQLTEAELRRAEVDETGSAIIVASDSCPRGIAGIVAARLAETHGKPAVVLSKDEGLDTYTGSARSGGVVDLFQGLAACAPMLRTWGGHPAAGGLSIDAANLSGFRDLFSRWVEKHRVEATPVAPEATITLAEYDLSACTILDAMEPFGPGNPTPLVRMDNVTLEPASRSQVLVRQGGYSLKMRVDRSVESLDMTSTSLLLELSGRGAIIKGAPSPVAAAVPDLASNSEVSLLPFPSAEARPRRRRAAAAAAAA